mgnify:CR=1 FL=1
MNQKYNSKFIENLSNIVPVVVIQTMRDEVSLVVSNKHLVVSLNILKKHINYQYSLLSCVSGVDMLNTDYRFAVVYDLLSIKYNSRIRVKTFLNEITTIPSAVPIFVNANWWEREVWDMFGIYFQNHPDMRRILTDYGFEGYPLRKDFPLSGFVEMKYNETEKRVKVVLQGSCNGCPSSTFTLKNGIENMLKDMLNDKDIVFEYADNGKGFPEGFNSSKSKSLGMQLISGLSKQLNAKLTVVSENGVQINITFKP